MGISFNMGVVVLALFLLGVAYYAYRGTTPAVPRPLRIFLVSLRVLAFLLIAFLMLDPRYIFELQKSEPPQAVVMVDRSASMALPVVGWKPGARPERFEQANEVARRVREIIEARGGEVVDVFFSGDVVSGDSARADGQGTDIRRSIASVYKKYETENLSALIVISDGVDTEDRLTRPALPPVPVFTVGVGDTSVPEDVRIADVDYNTIVRAPSRSTIDATLRYAGVAPKRVRLRLRENNRVLFEKDTLMTAEVMQIHQKIPVDFPKAGRRNLVLEAIVDGYDAASENDRRDIAIEVEKAGVKILIVDLLPTWELHFLTDFLRGDETFDFRLVSKLGDHASLKDGKFYAPEEFPRALDDYDALIIASIDEKFLSDDVASAITKFVRDEGKGLLVMPGHSSIFEHSSAWGRMKELLPARGRPPYRFNLQFTSVKPGAQASTNPITSRLMPLLSQTDWQQRSPLLGFYAPIAAKNGVEVLLETNEQRSPVFLYQKVGKGRVALVSAGPLWRWKFLAENNSLYDEMMSRLLDVLSRGEETERFVLHSKKNVYDSGESPMFTAEIFDEKMQPVTGAPVRVEITRIEKDGGETPLDIVSMRREGVDNPRFKVSLPPLAPGGYRVTGAAELPGRTIDSQTLDISVSDVSVEYQTVTQDRSNLMALAGQTGGAYADAAGADALVDGIVLEPRVASVTSEMTLRTSKWVFALVLLLLGVEWLTRKRAGMI